MKVIERGVEMALFADDLISCFVHRVPAADRLDLAFDDG